MELRITDLKAATVQANFEWTFVRVYAGELYGVGEAGPAPGLKGMEQHFKRLLVGEDAFKINRIEQKLRWAALYAGTTTYHMISAINMAIYDLIGKYLNLPVWRLLGGDRTEVRVYVDAHGGKGLEAMNSLLTPTELPWLKESEVESGRLISLNNPIHGRLSQERWNEDYSPKAYAERAKRLVGEGFTAIKFDLDVPTPYSKEYNVRSGDLSLKDIDYMAELVRAVREAVGDEVDIMFDLHWRYNINTAIRICKAIEPYRPRWLEDPTPANTTISNLEEFKLLTAHCSIPIETGENLYTVYQFKDLIPLGVRVWAPDIAKAGGISEGKRIAELAAMYDIEYSPHNIGSPIATMAHAHVASVANTFGVLEFHGHDVPFWGEIIKPKRRIIDRGFIRLGDEPGLGVDLDDEAMRRYWPDFQL
ncbi:MAG: mandelate racemase/muconate lactonizing enzyme family protein [Thermoproteus sp. AZ2]|jgi:L-alanine-DL-glutamate epimerase-like enolase superfamily enzyme|uniref:Mandelate racemase/muconate lactonizing enzyme family protein n=1 Tax=Thermoproteus sp. AZ2 TaxID=1609232 RepID=A0ACC6V329_9CREN|nr:MAG: mandelate racemase [Thermoproteus sp. AZ2]